MQEFCVPQTEALARFPFSHFYGEELLAASTSKVQAPAKTIPWPGQSGVSCVFCHIQGEESRVEASLGTLAVSGCDALINLPEIQAVVSCTLSLSLFLSMSLSLFISLSHSLFLSLTLSLSLSLSLPPFLPTSLPSSLPSSLPPYLPPYLPLSCHKRTIRFHSIQFKSDSSLRFLPRLA